MKVEVDVRQRLKNEVRLCRAQEQCKCRGGRPYGLCGRNETYEE